MKLLLPWMEFVGILMMVEQAETGAILIFEDGQKILVTEKTADDYQNLVHKRISVLKTDIPGKEILIKK